MKTTAFMRMSGLAVLLASTFAGAAFAAPTGRVTVAVAQLDGIDDPAKFGAALTYPLLKIAYDSLLTFGADGEIIPQLAESWSTPDGGKTWIFELRQGVTFSNGDTFDAEDAKATLEHYRSEGSALIGHLSNVREIVVDGPYTLRIVQENVDATLPLLMTDRPGVVISADALAQPEFPPLTSGSGPYILKEDNPGISQFYVANPDYWDPEAVGAAELMILRIEDPVSRANGLRSGEIDMALVSASQSQDIEMASGLNLYQIQGRSRVGLTINPNLYEPLKDERVRRALSMAIDREGQVYGLLFGQAEVASQFAPASDPFYTEGLPEMPYDIEGAKALLVEAGYGDGLSFTVTAPPRYRPLAEAMQADWAKIGVTIELVFPTGTGNAERLWYKPDIPVGFWAFDGRNDLGFFYKQIFAEQGMYNPSRYVEPEVADLIVAIEREADVAARRALIDDLSTLLSQSTGIQVPILHEYLIVGYSDDLTGVTPWQGQFPYIRGIGRAE